MPLSVNKKSFTLINRISKTYALALDGFQFATSLFFRIRDRIQITFNSSVIQKITTTINVSRIRLVISEMKLITSITQTFSARKVAFVFSLKEIGKVVTSIFIRAPMTFVSSAIQKIVISKMSAGKLLIDFDPTLAIFFLLGDFDPETLGTLDTETLGDMDYTT